MALKGVDDLSRYASRTGNSVDNVSDMFGSVRKYGPTFNRFQRATRSGARAIARNFKKVTDAAASQLEEIFKRIKENAKRAGREAEDAVDGSQAAKKQAGAAPDPKRGVNEAETVMKRQNFIGGIFGSDFPTYKVMGAVALTGMVTYAGIITDGTDGKSAVITKLQIDPDDNSFAIITYRDPSQAGYFIPAIGDTVTLSNNTGLGGANDCEIVDTPGSEMLKINITKMQNRPARGTIITPSPSAGDMTFVCHSDFGNQFAGAIDDLVVGVFGSLARTLNIAIDEAGNIILNAADLASSLVRRVVDETTDIAGDTFCKIVPLLCDSTVWWILAGLIIGGIILAVVFSSMPKK